MSSTRDSLLKGTAWIAGAKVLTNLMSLLSMLVLARLLTPNDFGLIAIGMTLLTILSSITEIPISEALVQHKSPTRDHLNTVWTISAGRAGLVALVFIGAAWPATRIYHEDRLIGVMMCLAITAFLSGLGNPRAIMMTKELVFWQQFMLQVVQKLVALIISVLIAVLYHNYWALLLGNLIGQAANVLVSYTVLPFLPRLSLKHTRELMSFSIWLTFCQVVNTINWRLDQLIIGAFLDKSVLGYYTVGDNLAAIPTREAIAPLTVTLFPAFSRLSDQKDRLTTAYQSAQAFMTAVAFPIGAGVALIADPLVRLTMGDKWIPVVFIVQALSAVFAFQTIGSLAQPLAMAVGETKLLFKRDWQGLVMRVPLIIVGAYFMGMPGIVYARVFTGTAGLLLNTNVVTRITGLTLWQQLTVNVRSLSSTAAMTVVLIGLHYQMPTSASALQNGIKIAIMVIVGAAVYTGGSFMLWRMMGSPKGPETEVLAVLGKLRKRLVRGSQPPSDPAVAGQA